MTLGVNFLCHSGGAIILPRKMPGNFNSTALISETWGERHLSILMTCVNRFMSLGSIFFSLFTLKTLSLRLKIIISKFIIKTLCDSKILAKALYLIFLVTTGLNIPRDIKMHAHSSLLTFFAGLITYFKKTNMIKLKPWGQWMRYLIKHCSIKVTISS